MEFLDRVLFPLSIRRFVVALFKPVTEKRKVLKGEVFSIDSYCGNSRQSATRRVRVETNLVMQGFDAQRDSLEGKRKLTGSWKGTAFAVCTQSIEMTGIFDRKI